MNVLQADARAIPLADESVQTVVTSPPYWGLRDYGLGDKGIGLEDSPEAWVEQMVQVFREVRRVLRPDGTVWLNVGDAYAARGYSGGLNGIQNPASVTGPRGWRPAPEGFKSKDLIGLPWRLAFALQADGWWLRSDIIWAKPNPMPESVTDRPTRAHEYVFLLTRSARYFYDAEAVRIPAAAASYARWAQEITSQRGSSRANGGRKTNGPMRAVGGPERDEHVIPEQQRFGANLRSVWTVATQSFREAHFSTFPKALVKPCIKAGTSERGCCPICGAPWVRVVERHPVARNGERNVGGRVDGFTRPAGGQREWDERAFQPDITTGWQPTCDHESEPVPCLVLDPFFGSGTVGVVARKLGRRFVGVDLSGDYCRMATERIRREAPLNLFDL